MIFKRGSNARVPSRATVDARARARVTGVMDAGARGGKTSFDASVTTGGEGCVEISETDFWTTNHRQTKRGDAREERESDEQSVAMRDARGDERGDD